jgi:putative nucleotidyltransferase with HDIG domain
MRYESLFLMREGEKRVQALAQNLAANARDPLLIGDDLRLGPITQSVMREEDVLYAFVANHEGTIVYHPDGQRIGGQYPGEAVLSGDQELLAAVPIVIEGTTVGHAVVGLGLDFIKEAMTATALGLLLPLGLGTLISVWGIFWLTGVHVRRIENLEVAVQALGAGERLVKTEVKGRDEVGRLARHFNHMVRQLETAQGELESSVAQTVSALAAAIEAKDVYTRGHCERVARISYAMAEQMGVEDTDLRDLELAAFLHDIGKIGVPGSAIGKKSRLTESEMQNMQEHPEIGARILSPISFLERVGTYVRHHHEHYDGSGYPAGIAGDAIPLASRIIHLVDAYDAMTTTRSYRAGLDHEEAVRRIRRGAGEQFDPEIVDCFLRLYDEGVISAIYENTGESQAR